MPAKYLLIVLAVSVNVLAQGLGQDYTMGRIIGGNPFLEATAARSSLEDSAASFQSTSSILLYSLGSRDHWQTDLVLQASKERTDEASLTKFYISSWSGVWRPAPGQYLEWGLHTPTLGVYRERDYSGADWYLASQHQYRQQTLWFDGAHRMLSQEGRIIVEGEGYEATFLRGPLLNSGQYRHTLHAGVRLGSASDSGWRNGDAEFLWMPSFGLTNNLQWSGYASAQNNVGQGFNGMTGSGLELRISSFWLSTEAIANYGDSTPNPTHLLPWIFHGQSGIILGSRDLKLLQVKGNWNHVFDPQLGFGQLLLSGDGRIDPERRDSATHQYLSISGAAAAGVLPYVTFGIRGQRQGWDDQPWESTYLRTTLCLSTIPLREEGPEDVSPVEYRWNAILPPPGTFRIMGGWNMAFGQSRLSEGRNAAEMSWADYSVTQFGRDISGRFDADFLAGLPFGFHAVAGYVWAKPQASSRLGIGWAGPRFAAEGAWRWLDSDLTADGWGLDGRLTGSF